MMGDTYKTAVSRLVMDGLICFQFLEVNILRQGCKTSHFVVLLHILL